MNNINLAESLTATHWKSNRRTFNMKLLGLILLCVSAASAFRAGYVIGGEDTEITDWPFMVSLQSFGHFCGGVLYDSTHVVTAGHCVIGSNPGSIDILVGTNSQDNPEDGGQPATYGLSDITVHPDYGLYNDIAILEVDGEVETDGTYVDTITLAGADAEDFVGADCEIAGWGQTESDFSPDILQFAPVDVISTADCQDDWSWMNDLYICIRDDSGEQGACFGDSGGPMTCIDSSGNRVLTGVTSGGDGGCDTSVAAYYTRISEYYDWIQENS